MEQDAEKVRTQARKFAELYRGALDGGGSLTPALMAEALARYEELFEIVVGNQATPGPNMPMPGCFTLPTPDRQSMEH